MHITNSAKKITAKFKRLRKCLKHWDKSISQLSNSIKATNDVIFFFHNIEEFRPLTDAEWNGRDFLKKTPIIPTRDAKGLLEENGHNKMG